MKNFRYINSVLGVCLFAFGFLIFREAGNYVPEIEIDGQVGAHAFPQLFAVALMVISALMALLDLKKLTKPTTASFAGIGAVAVTAGFCYAFWYFLPEVGFLIMAPLFACTVTAITTRRFRIMDMIPVLLVVFAVYFVFANLLKVPVPAGFLG